MLATLITLAGCSLKDNKQQKTEAPVFEKGTFGYDAQFFTKNNIETVALTDSTTGAMVLIVPAYQGRVMTSSAQGNKGNSFGWINYSYIESGKKSTQFNPYGGEERFWIGPEGGPFSIYFKKGQEQVFESWVVPKEIDTEPFEIVSQTSASAAFKKDFTLVNASGIEMPVGIERKVTVLSRNQAEQALNLKLDDSLSFVAYESENTMMNKGKTAWDKKSGALSIWMLAMFNPSEKGVVVIPFKEGNEKDLGKKATDDYFGKVPSDRLIVKDNVLFFKVDGKHRSKIGISPLRALPFSGSYDPESQTLTILWYSAPEKPMEYVNSKWGKQDNPFIGDAVNSYNDGPVADGSIMGPFYEIESSSPAAFLAPGSKIVHTQRIFHISGAESKLNPITRQIFNLSVEEIKNAFMK